MKFRIKGTIIILILLSTMMLCGFKKKPVTLDTETSFLFQNISVEKIASDVEKDSDLAKEKYDGSYYMILGKIIEISKDNKNITVSGASNSARATVECSASDKAVIAAMKELKVSDTVKVYGKTKVGLINKDVSLEILQITSAEITDISETAYSFIDGKSYDTKNMSSRELADGKVKYFIPHNWIDVERNIVKNDLGSMEGYQYTLNEISGDLAVEPESIFVGYFNSKEKLRDRSQIGETREIRKTIIANILKTGGERVKNSEIKKRKSYYGAEYYYYDGAYEDKQGKGHHVEFVFQEVDNDGMVVYLYVYNEENHMDDILSVMRCLAVS